MPEFSIHELIASARIIVISMLNDDLDNERLILLNDLLKQLTIRFEQSLDPNLLTYDGK